VRRPRARSRAGDGALAARGAPSDLARPAGDRAIPARVTEDGGRMTQDARPTTELDHLAIAAHTLEQGLAHVRDALGVDMPYGGKHPRMGTHNHLLRLGERVYVEVIAIDPSAPAPSRPRWFQLDDPALQAELRVAPQLVTWV